MKKDRGHGVLKETDVKWEVQANRQREGKGREVEEEEKYQYLPCPAAI